MKKLLMTASVYSHIQSFHLPYLQEFRRLGWETHIGCSQIPDTLPACIDCAIELTFRKRMSAYENFQAAMVLRKRIRAEQYDLIITHTSLAAFFTRLALKGIKGQARLVNVVHGYLFDDETPAIKRSILLNAERFTAAETDLVLTMNAWDYLAAQKYRLGKQIEKIPGMGVDFSRLDPASEEDGQALRAVLGIPSSAFVVICPAEFSERKSQHILIEAMAKLPPEAVLVLPGSGALLEDCKSLARRLSLEERVWFPGFVSELAPWYRMADAAVTASRSEGLPFSVMEAMYCGLPVAASAVKGHLDLINDGITGLLYPYGDVSACAACIDRFMTDAAFRETAASASKAAVQDYALEKVLPTVVHMYLQLEQT